MRKVTQSKVSEPLKNWESEVMYGKYIGSMDRQLISDEDTFPVAVKERSEMRK